MTTYNVGDVVAAKGYGGFATIVDREETPLSNRNGEPIFKYTVEFGPNSPKLPGRKVGYRASHEFYGSALTPKDGEAKADEPALDNMSERELAELVLALEEQIRSAKENA